ncbi:MAG: cell division protein FtsQ/DivIB, partial [Clostridium sp.]
TVNENELQEQVKEFIGQNIFTINYNEMEKKILKNPYIKEATITKKNINKLNVVVSEGKVSYYIEDGEKFKIITNDGYYVESLDTIEELNLVNVIGLKDNGKSVGEKIIDDENLCNNLEKFYPILKSEFTDLRIEKLDVSNILDIKAYIGNIEIKFGDSSNLVNEYDKLGAIYKIGKINKVLNIIEQNNMKKGYIDVSFDGEPVVKIET